MRSVLITLHRYAGLLLGALISFSGLTGSLLVFDHALDEVIAPQTVAFQPADSSAPLQSVIDSARAAVPGNPQPSRIQLARKAGSPHVVRFPGPEGAAGPLEVSVSPVDSRVLAVRNWGESSYLMSWMYRLHYTLLAGDTGKKIVGVGGLALLFFCLSGIVIWWPRSGRWRRAFTVRRDTGPFRFIFDLHKTAGIYFLLVLVVVAFSGVRLVFQKPVEKLVSTVMPLDPPLSPQSTGPGGRALNVDEAVAIGIKAFPNAELKRVFLPQNASASYRLGFKMPGEPWTHHAGSSVWVDQYSGEILGVWDVNQVAAGSKFIAWQFPLHNGDALGLVGRWIVFFTGFVPTLLFGTGLYMWWRKYRLSGAAAKVRRAVADRA